MDFSRSSMPGYSVVGRMSPMIYVAESTGQVFTLRLGAGPVLRAALGFAVRTRVVLARSTIPERQGRKLDLGLVRRDLVPLLEAKCEPDLFAELQTRIKRHLELVPSSGTRPRKHPLAGDRVVGDGRVATLFDFKNLHERPMPGIYEGRDRDRGRELLDRQSSHEPLGKRQATSYRERSRREIARG